MHRRKWIRNTGAAGVGLALAPHLASAHYQADNQSIEIRPRWQEAGNPLRHTWAGLGNVDQLRWIMRGDMQEQLEMCHDEIALQHVRAVGVFDDDLYALSRDPANYLNAEMRERTRANWRSPFYIYDTLVARGMKPVVTPCFTPTELASGDKTTFQTRNNITPPQDWKQWERFIKDFVRALADRYGVETLKTWYFEAWNEPNLDGFWTGGQEGYWRLYRILHDTIKTVDPALRIGGPSTARGEWIDEMLTFGEKNDCVPDYIIGHCYNNDSASAPLSPFEGPQKDKENKSPNFTAGVVRGIRRIMNEHNYQGEFHMNEWGLSWYPFNPVRETANEAAFIAKTMNEVSQEADYFAYWCLSDIYNQVGYGREAFHGNYGMLTMDGLRKPNYFAHQLLNRLGNQQITVEGTGLGDSTNALVSRSESGVQAMVYAFDINYQAGDTPGTCSVTLDLPNNLNPSTAKIYRLDDEHNSVMQAWQQMGSPAIPTPAEVEKLKSVNTLRSDSATNLISQTNQGYQATFSMPSPAVAFLEVDTA